MRLVNTSSGDRISGGSCLLKPVIAEPPVKDLLHRMAALVDWTLRLAAILRRSEIYYLKSQIEPPHRTPIDSGMRKLNRQGI